MDKFKEIKQVLKCTDVVQKYLGLPQKTTGAGNWYRSPFRDERTSSLCVSNSKGIHDFGDSSHYDIISFTAKYFSITQGDALKLLCSDFNLNFENENEQTWKFLKQQQENERIYRLQVNNWFNNSFARLSNESRFNQKLIGILEKNFDFDDENRINILEKLYSRQVRVETELDTFEEASRQEDKEKLYLEFKNRSNSEKKTIEPISNITQASLEQRRKEEDLEL